MLTAESVQQEQLQVQILLLLVVCVCVCICLESLRGIAHLHRAIESVLVLTFRSMREKATLVSVPSGPCAVGYFSYV